MKKLVLSCIIATISLIGNAQNANWGDTLSLPAAHQPLLKDGKSWHYRKTQKVSEDLENLRVVVDTTYVNLTVRGDTIIDGQQCWKVYWETADTSYLHNIWLEDGMFVYVIDTEKGNMKNFVFNFTPKKGNHLKDWGLNWYLNTIDAVECWGQYYNRYHYRSTNGSDDGPLLVAGIGTFNGIENRTGDVGGWNSFLFLSCYEDDKLIFSQGDFFKACSRPFSEDNKVWYYVHMDFPGKYDYQYSTDGDTIINGQKALRLYKFEPRKSQTATYIGSIYDEGKKSFFIDAGKDEAVLLYDFNVCKGDTFLISGNKLFVEKDTVMENNGLPYRLLEINNLTTVDPNDPYSTYSGGYWIEGVGTTGPYLTYQTYWSGYDHRGLVGCSVNGELIFGTAGATLGIEKMMPSRQQKGKEDSALYDLSGRRVSVSSVLPKGVYIQNGKKFVIK